MTFEEYNEAVRGVLALTPSNVPNVFRDRDGNTFSVPDTIDETYDQRRETFETLRERVRLMESN